MVDIRFIEPHEVVEFRQAISLGFGEDDVSTGEGTEEEHAGWLALFPIGTTIGAFDRGHIVGTFGSFDLELTVPGGSAAIAGTTIVTVQPTHRRRGILRSMMRTHLDQMSERGHLAAALWASEERIYGRFGYGQACSGHALEIPGNRVSLPPGPSEISVRPLNPTEAREIVPGLYDQVRPTTPGLFARSEPWWSRRHFDDLPEKRGTGQTARRYTLAERDGEAVGYVVYRHRRIPDDNGPDAYADIQEMVAVDDDARRSLWHFMNNIDLFPNLTWWNAPVDDPVFVEADRFRAIGRRLNDTMWIRLLDVVGALEARTYERDGSLVIDIADGFMARGGRFALEVTGGKSRCEPSTAEADVQLDIADLGALYLGGGSAITMGRAGRIVGSDQHVRQLDDLFRTSRAPYCIEVF